MATADGLDSELFRSAPEAMWVFDVETLLFLDVNDEAVARYGYSRGEFLQMTVADIRPPEDTAALKASVGGGRDRPDRSGNWRHLTKDGRQLWVEVSSAPVTYGDRRAHLVIARDVTERRRAEVDLRKAQRMEAVGRLAGAIAHDFNNLLMIIQGNCDLALADLPPDGPNREDLLEIKLAADRAAQLISRLRRFLDRPPGVPEVVNVGAVIEDIAPLLRSLLGARIRLEVRVAAALEPLVIDHAQLEQAVVSLIGNARDAMPEGGTVILTARSATLGTDEGQAPGLKPGRYVVLEMADSGVGRPAETVGRTFVPVAESA